VYKTKRISKSEFELRNELEKYSEEQKKRDSEIDRELAFLFRQSLEEPLLVPDINKESLEYYFTDKIRYGTSMDILVHEETVPMIVSEFALSIKKGKHQKALKEFRDIIEKNHHLHFPVDLRFTAAEESYLSAANGEPVFYIGICVREYKGKEIPEVMQVFIELMREYDARPNWGKISDFEKSDFEKSFLEMEKFKTVRNFLDPKGVFMNKKMQEWF
jgi:L-gulonolactone oxidase